MAACGCCQCFVQATHHTCSLGRRCSRLSAPGDRQTELAARRLVIFFGSFGRSIVQNFLGSASLGNSYSGSAHTAHSRISFPHPLAINQTSARRAHPRNQLLSQAWTPGPRIDKPPGSGMMHSQLAQTTAGGAPLHSYRQATRLSQTSGTQVQVPVIPPGGKATAPTGYTTDPNAAVTRTSSWPAGPAAHAPGRPGASVRQPCSSPYRCSKASSGKADVCPR